LRLDKDFEHLKHGYALTSQAAQGKTVDRVLVAQSVSLSQHASDMNQIYVSLSRGRNGFGLYTDDFELLKDYVCRVRERPMATELLAEKPELEMRAEPEEKLSAEFGKADAPAINAKLEKQLMDLDKVLVPQPACKVEEELIITPSM